MAGRERQDRLTLVGIRLNPRIGVTPEERYAPQACSADVTVWGDFEAAGSTDSLAAAIDYGSILAQVIETAHEREYNLVETLAYRLGRKVLESCPARRVNVRVRKQPASMAGKLDHVEIEVEQS